MVFKCVISWAKISYLVGSWFQSCPSGLSFFYKLKISCLKNDLFWIPDFIYYFTDKYSLYAHTVCTRYQLFKVVFKALNCFKQIYYWLFFRIYFNSCPMILCLRLFKGQRLLTKIEAWLLFLCTYCKLWHTLLQNVRGTGFANIFKKNHNLYSCQ